MSVFIAALLKLLADSPSITAAMKAGKQTQISVRVYKAAEGRWYDLGPVSTASGRWDAVLGGLAKAKVVLRFRWRGRDYERPTY